MLGYYDLRHSDSNRARGRFSDAKSTFSGNKTALRMRSSPSRNAAAGKSMAFKHHCEAWKSDTEYVSSLHEKYLHPSYASIIGMGAQALPYILESMKKEPDDWFYALRSITGDNPVTNDMTGDMRRMTAAWIEWGASRGLA